MLSGPWGTDMRAWRGRRGGLRCGGCAWTPGRYGRFTGWRTVEAVEKSGWWLARWWFGDERRARGVRGSMVGRMRRGSLLGMGYK
uniref:Uncharacterized protein n=1 Tax=Knipowitschia caucasica TaxID=637954 RepID=A0AAV2MKG4_KNICA